MRTEKHLQLREVECGGNGPCSQEVSAFSAFLHAISLLTRPLLDSIKLTLYASLLLVYQTAYRLQCSLV
jgi:hypothetical protein